MSQDEQARLSCRTVTGGMMNYRFSRMPVLFATARGALAIEQALVERPYFPKAKSWRLAVNPLQRGAGALVTC